MVAMEPSRHTQLRAVDAPGIEKAGGVFANSRQYDAICRSTIILQRPDRDRKKSFKTRFWPFYGTDSGTCRGPA